VHVQFAFCHLLVGLTWWAHTIQATLHWTSDGQNLTGAVAAFVMLVTGGSKLAIMVAINSLVEVIYRVPFSSRLWNMELELQVFLELRAPCIFSKIARFKKISYNTLSSDRIALIFSSLDSPCKSAGDHRFIFSKYVPYWFVSTIAWFWFTPSILTSDTFSIFWEIFMMYIMNILRALSIQIFEKSIYWIYWKWK
jgi:hypothetical protein